jgi:DNA-binding LytR/AlgR family response regulator
MNRKNFDVYFRDLQSEAKRDGVRVDRADEYALWTATALSNMIDAVKAYALSHYETDGWDIVIECYSDDDIAAIIKTARTPAGAIRMVRAEVKPRADYRADIQSEAF